MKKTLTKKVRQHLKLLEKGKAAYARAEELLEEIVAAAKPGAEFVLSGEKKVRLVDHYAEKNRVYRAHGISRFGLEEVKDQK